MSPPSLPPTHTLYLQLMSSFAISLFLKAVNKKCWMFFTQSRNFPKKVIQLNFGEWVWLRAFQHPSWIFLVYLLWSKFTCHISGTGLITIALEVYLIYVVFALNFEIWSHSEPSPLSVMEEGGNLCANISNNFVFCIVHSLCKHSCFFANLIIREHKNCIGCRLPPWLPANVSTAFTEREVGGGANFGRRNLNFLSFFAIDLVKALDCLLPSLFSRFFVISIYTMVGTVWQTPFPFLLFPWGAYFIAIVFFALIQSL